MIPIGAPAAAIIAIYGLFPFRYQYARKTQADREAVALLRRGKLAPFLELMLIRDYIWLPIEQVTELEISRPERPRDLLWTPVRVGLVDGTQRRAYMPARYVDSHQVDDELVKLGRATDWIGTEGGPVTGVGMRQFLAGDEACAMLELEDVAFDARTA